MFSISEDEENEENSSAEEEVYFEEQNSDCDMNEVVKENKEDKKINVDTKAPKKVGRPDCRTRTKSRFDESF